MKATNIIHWFGDDFPACDEHMHSLASVLRAPLRVTGCEPLEECEGCANERLDIPAFARLCSGSVAATTCRKESSPSYSRIRRPLPCP
jgi:hypothetical protein